MTKHHGNGRAVYKKALQEIVYRARLTTLNLSHPYATEDRTKPHLVKLVKDFVKDYKGSRNWTCRSQHFLGIVLTKGLYYGYKGKGYVSEVVTIAKKLLLDGFEDTKDDLDKAQSQQDNDKETKSRR